MAEHNRTGTDGEELAAGYLERQGYQVLGRNITNARGVRLGELDIVAEKKREIVFVEVKTLRRSPGGEEWLPEWHVTPEKLHKLERIARYYLEKEDLSQREYRFDVVSVILCEGKEPEIKHIEHAFF